MQQWEFAFVSANGRKPSFMERREDATQVRRATDLIELRQRSASLHRVLCAVNSYTYRDGLLEAKQPAVLAALALFLSVDVNHDGRVAEDELERCASRLQPHASRLQPYVSRQQPNVSGPAMSSSWSYCG